MRLMNRTVLIVAASALLLSACESEQKRPATGSLVHQLKLVGPDGKLYGKAELDPVGGGRLYDINGRLLGTVVPAQ